MYIPACLCICMCARLLTDFHGESTVGLISFSISRCCRNKICRDPDRAHVPYHVSTAFRHPTSDNSMLMHRENKKLIIGKLY